MKKILLGFSGTRFSDSIFQFASRLNEMEPVLLVGVFLPDVVYADIYSFGGGLPTTYAAPLTSSDDEERILQNMDRFATLCQHHGIAYRVHNDIYSMPLPELKQETRFADLLIVSSEKFYDTLGFNDANPSLKEIMHAAECPVIVVPETFQFPESNVLAYDGSEASVFAIKQFAYLFPELCRNETLLVYMKEEPNALFPDEIKIEELVTQHFKDLSLLKLNLNPKKEFAAWLHQRKNSILIGGSFGRSPMSQFFRKSFIAEIIAEHKLPVFSAHA